MSATYTLHLPADAFPGDPDALERADLVRDGFSWGAFLVPPLWFFWHRHLVAGVFALVVVLAVWFGFSALHFRTGTILAIELLVHVLFGLEGASLRRFAYEKRRRPAADLVIAADRGEAETKAFARWLTAIPDARPSAGRPAIMSYAARDPEPVIGLFPDLEGRP